MSSLNVGDLVTVGKSDFPAQIVRFLDNLVEVKWLDSGQSKYETIYPCESIKPVSRRRNRVPIKRFTEGNDDEKESEEKEEEKKKSAKGRRAVSKKKAPSVTRKRANNNAVPQQEEAKPYHPIKLKATKSASGTKARQAAKKSAAAKPPPPAKKLKTTAQLKSDYSRLNGIAKHPDATSDSDSDEELLAEARRVSQGRKSFRHDSDTDVDRKPAAKSLELSSSDSSSSSSIDSSDDELKRARQAGRKAKGKPQKRPYSSKHNDDDIMGASPQAQPVVDLAASSTETESDFYESEGSVSSEEPTTPVAVKEEETLPLEVVPLEVGDHVWIQDGAKHAAQVISVVGDMLKVKWANGSTADNLVPTSTASRMFDLTEGTVDVGRPRRSTRSRHKPEMLGAVKKEEPSTRKQRASRKKKGKGTPSALKPKRKVKKMPVSRKTKKRSRALEVIDDDAAVDPVTIDVSEDDSDADTEATFEYTAPRVDGKFRSRHVHSNVDSFMKVKPWEQTSGVDIQISQEDAQINSNETALLGGSRVYDVEMSPPPKAIFRTNASERENEQDQSVSQECARLLRGTPSRTDNACHTDEGGDDARSIIASPSRGTETEALDLEKFDNDEEGLRHRESTETAASDEIRDIFSQGDTQLAEANEERLTADSQDLSRVFAAFADTDLNTQPEAMCM